MTKAQKFVNKWATHQFSSECYSGEDYLTFERAFRTVLKDEATKGGFSLKNFLKNHYCCSAVLIDSEGRHAYVSLPDVRPTTNFRVLYRTMQHEKDWTGGHNNYSHIEDLGENLSRLY